MKTKDILYAVKNYVETDELLGKDYALLELKGLLNKNRLDYKLNNEVIREKLISDNIRFSFSTVIEKNLIVNIFLEVWIQKNAHVPNSYSENLTESETNKYHGKVLDVLNKRFADNSSSKTKSVLMYADYDVDYDRFVGLVIKFCHNFYYTILDQEDSTYNVSEEIYKLIKDSYNLFFIDDLKFRDSLINLINPLKLISVEMNKSNDEIEAFGNDYQKKLDQITEKNKKK